MATKAGDWTSAGENLLRFRGGNYYLNAKIAGKVVRKSLKTVNLKVAKARRDADLAKLRSLSVVEPSDVVTLGDAIELVGKRLQAKAEVKERTRAYYSETIAFLKATMPVNERASRWSKDSAAAWWKAASGKRAAIFANNVLNIARHVAAVMIEAGVRTDDPTKGLGRMRAKKTKLDELPSVEDLEKIIESIRNSGSHHGPQSAAFVGFLAWSGLRISEARAIEWEHIAGDWLIVTGGATGTKNHETRRVPISLQLRAVIDSLRYDGATGPLLTIQTPAASLTAACKRLGFRHLRVHDLRHWFATHAIESGVDVPTVAKWLGHKDGGALAMKTYGHVRDDHSLEAVKKL